MAQCAAVHFLFYDVRGVIMEQYEKQYQKEKRRHVFLLVYSVLECALLWLGLHYFVPALVIVVNVVLVLYKAFEVGANIAFYKKQGFYHGHHNNDPDAWKWPFAVFLVLDIAAIVFCKRNTIVFIIISAIYTVASLVILIYTREEYVEIRNIMDGHGNYRFRIK